MAAIHFVRTRSSSKRQLRLADDLDAARTATMAATR
jgi:hypothetical protein